MDVWAVIYSNYEPDEVDSLWTTKAEAQKRCDELNEASTTGMWDIAKRYVHNIWKPESRTT